MCRSWYSIKSWTLYHILWYSITGALQYIHLYLYLNYNSTIKITAWSTTKLYNNKRVQQTKFCNLYINNNNKKQLIIFICVFTAENFLLFPFLCMKYITICMLCLAVKFPQFKWRTFNLSLSSVCCASC